MAGPNVFWDTNVLIDFLLERSPYSVDANAMFDMAHGRKISLATSETAITTAIYVCRGTRVAEALLVFLNYAVVVPADQHAIRNALASPFKGKEDAILYHLALHHKMDAFITRDKKDFTRYASPLLPVLTPKEFMKQQQ